jgi:hypothetical protein
MPEQESCHASQPRARSALELAFGLDASAVVVSSRLFASDTTAPTIAASSGSSTTSRTNVRSILRPWIGRLSNRQ